MNKDEAFEPKEETATTEASSSTMNKDALEQDESYLFKEKKKVFDCIDRLVPKESNNAPIATEESGDEIEDATDDEKEPRAALEMIRTILDKYLECPTLLDPSLPSMVEKLVLQVKDQLMRNDLGSDPAIHTGQDDIDARIVSMTQRTKYPLTAIYYITKVRGYKRVNRFLSHNVEDVDLIWMALMDWRKFHDTAMQGTNGGSINSQSTFFWEPLYVLWHWMGTLSLVPFSSKVVSGDDNLVQSILSTFQRDLVTLTSFGPVQEAECTCLAAWLSRPDAATTKNRQPNNSESHILSDFSKWAQQQVLSVVKPSDKGQHVSKRNGSNVLLGILQVVTKILKHASVSRVILIQQLIETLWEPLLLLGNEEQNNLLLCRYLVKWFTRTSVAYLKNSNPNTNATAAATWRYQRGQRRLLDLRTTGDGKIQEEQYQPIDADQTQQKTKASTAGNGRNSSLFQVPDQVEDAMGRILEALAHSSTVVRWSAAKGVGRVTEQLPAVCALDVLDAVLEYFENPERHDCWHGACLALAEMARKGLLLPASLPLVIPEIVKAIKYDVRRGHSSVGSNVRDAACYAFWAFARSYSPSVLRDHLDRLAEAVVLTSLFDREVNCRRAASAAFQEAVGRQGMASFPNGIYVVTTADFFSLGNRTEAYTSIASKIAKLPEYRFPIIQNLYQNKLFHWDPVIRELSSRALGSVAHLDPEHIAESAVPFLLEKSLDSKNLNVRHGAVLGVAEIIRSLGADRDVLQTILSQSTMATLLDLVNQIEKRRLYRGRGGEIMRVAVCRLVECISLARLKLDVKNQVKMLDAVDSSIPHPNEEIQACASRALSQLLTNYFPVSDKGPSDRLRARVLDKFLSQVSTSKNPAATRGYCLATGHLPAKLVATTGASLDSVIRTLSRAANPKAKVDGEGDAETRRNAVNALSSFTKTVVKAAKEPDKVSYPVNPLTPEQCNRVVNAFLWALEDYNVDRRGDVGSWCRIAAMDGLTSLILLCDELPEDESKRIFSSLSGTKVVAAFIKQLGEKLDLVRLHAAKCLQKVLVRADDAFPTIVGRQEVMTSLELAQSGINFSWGDPKVVFLRVMRAAMVVEKDAKGTNDEQAISYPYYNSAIAGIIISVGGKAESAHATAALLDHAKNAIGTPTTDRLGRILLKLFERHNGIGRVTLPLLKSIEKLLTRGCLDSLLTEGRDFASSLLKYMEAEIKNCRDIHRLFALADVAGALSSAISPKTDEKRSCLKFMCLLLGHEYPRVRSHVAEILYLALEDMGGENESLVSVSTLVLETPWGTDVTDVELSAFSSDVKTNLGFD